MVVADGHEEALLLRMIEEMVACALTGREAAVVALLMTYLWAPRINVALPFRMKCVFLAQVVVKSVRVLPGLKHVDSDADLGSAPIAA
jgi:hypothetical protein